MKHLAVVGGGFAGLWATLCAAREFWLAGEEAHLTLVSRDEFLTVRPRLYEAFTPQMRVPLASILSAVGAELLVGEVTRVDLSHQRLDVVTGDGMTRGAHYARLVLATGSEQRPLPLPGVATHAFDIDTYAAAERLEHHLQTLVGGSRDPAALTVVIVGAGFTGIELATGMRARLRAMVGDAIAATARVVLVERASTVGPELGLAPQSHLLAALEVSGVEVLLDSGITAVKADGVQLTNGHHIATRTVVITTGLMAAGLGTTLGVACDALGRVEVDRHLRVAACEALFAAGDAAHAQVDATHFALMSCQHAVPMGKHAGYNAARDLLGLPLREYQQPDYVTCLDLGDYGALLSSGWAREPVQWGPEVKALKRTINTQWIYPPAATHTALMAAADLDAPWPPPT